MLNMSQPLINPFDDEPDEIALTQAQRVVAKFGGARDLYRALLRLGDGRRRDPSNVYRWIYKGVIPSSAIYDVMEAARIEGVMLTAEDLYPGRHP